MDTELMLDVGQANELKLAFRRSGYTNADIKKLCEGDILARLLSIVRGDNEFLKLISGSESLVLAPLDGKEILADARDMFVYVDSDFRNYDADEKGSATKNTLVLVYEMTKDATFSQIFGSLSGDLEKICLTQAQIKNFVRKYRNWLRTNGYATFFLFKSHGNFFVAGVVVFSVGRLYVYVYRFEDSDLWDVEFRRRVVVPQLA